MATQSLIRARLSAARRWFNLTGTRRHCVACDSTFRSFYPFRGTRTGYSPFISRLDFVSGDVVNYECPACGANDRERHLLMYLKVLGILDALRDARVLHFAPEPQIRARLDSAGVQEYVLADLIPSAEDIQPIDVTNIPLPDGHFDLVLCNHVLEHVDDDVLALGEIARVLRPGGVAVLQTPYASRLANTFEEPDLISDADRVFFYGQADHARLYGRDLVERVARAGLVPETHSHQEVLGNLDPVREGVSAAEGLLLGKKPLL